MTSSGRAGALALAALAIGALGVGSASGSGLTAVKCVELGAEHKYGTSQCLTPAEGGSYETVPIEGTTEIEGKSTTPSHEEGGAGNPVVQFMAHLAGEEIRVSCNKATLTGKVSNVVFEGEMRAHGTEGVVQYSECHATLTPSSEKKCSVQGTAPATEVGKIQSNKLTLTTGPEHAVTIKPEEGSVFTKFTILGGPAPCFFKNNVAVEVTGSVSGIANTETHSHLTFTLESGSGFKANGALATYESTVTAWMKGEEKQVVGFETF